MSDEVVTGSTFGGMEWIPNYVSNLDQKKCIACGRCFKVCPRDVFTLVEKDGLVVAAEDDDDDWDDDDDESMVMIISNDLDCIGCEACSKVCPKDCFTHVPKKVA